MNLGLWNQGIRLAGLSDEELVKVSQETGIAYPMLKSQQMAEMANMGNQMPGEENENFVPTVEIKLHANPKNPRKARKKNIKMLRKALRPPRFWFGFFSIYRYNAAHECACCGADIRRFIEGSDNAYAHIIDEDTRMSLADIYWFDEDTGQPRKPHARTYGDIGDELIAHYALPTCTYITHSRNSHRKRCFKVKACQSQQAWEPNSCEFQVCHLRSRGIARLLSL